MGVRREIAVEELAPGMLVKTAAGALKPIRWVGWSDVSLRFADRQRAHPICIRAGALGTNLPGA